MGIPHDVVLEGYTLIEQHEIDHEFLLLGPPFSSHTPVLLALTILGLGLVGLAVLCRIFNKPGALAAGLIGAVLALIKLWWLPISLASQFSDFQVWGYTWKYYPQYWLIQSLIVVAIAVVGLLAAVLRPKKSTAN